MYKGASGFLQRNPKYGKGPSPAKKRKQPIPRELWHALKSQELIKGKVNYEVKGGYSVTIRKCRAFCPHSEMYPRPMTLIDLHKLYCEPIEFVVIEIGLHSVVVSRKKAVQKRA